MPQIGPFELIIIAFILLLLFGAKRIPEISRSLGSGMREFKEGITDSGEDEAGKEAIAPPQPQITTATTTPPVTERRQ
jgi:sec-independent protein translocase protein TatA